MSELVSLRGFGMVYLAEKLWWDGTVEDKVAVEQLDLSNGLPASDGRRTGRGSHVQCHVRVVCVAICVHRVRGMREIEVARCV